jgi:Family of unknown function (DUF6169)
MSILLPYNITHRENRYIFHTDNSVVYSVEFTDGAFYFFNLPAHIPVFEISIKVSNGVDNILQPYDERTEATIVHILRAFFEDNKNSLIYVCDNEGNRQQARSRKFHGWFRKNKTENIEKYDVIFDALEMQILASLIVHTQNPDKDLIVNLFLGLFK